MKKMGNPPKRVLLNKLIRRYFKKQSASVGTEEAAMLKNELINCWESYGVDHPKCSHLIPKLDRGWALDLVAANNFNQ